MRLFFRSLTILALLLILAFLSLAIAAALFFNPNDLKPHLAGYALRGTGKSLRIDGDITLSIFPSIQVEVGPLLLEDSPAFGDAPFLQIDKISGQLALGPLLRGEVVVTALLLERPHLKLARTRAGEPNWRMPRAAFTVAPDGSVSGIITETTSDAPDDLAGGLRVTPLREGGAPSPPPAPVSLDQLHITELRVHNARISYHDFGSGELMAARLPRASLKNLSTGEQTNFDLQGSLAFGGNGWEQPFALEGAATLFAADTGDIPLSLAGMLAETSLRLEGALTLPEGERGTPSFHGSLTIGTLELDRYLNPKAVQPDEPDYGLPPPVLSRAERQEAERQEAEKENAILRRLGDLDISLELAVESLITGKFALDRITATLALDKGRLSLPGFTAAFAGGSLDLQAVLENRDGVPALSSAGKAENLRLPEVFAALSSSGNPMLGRLGLSWDMKGQGLSWDRLAPALSGRFSLAITNGFIPSVPIVPPGIPDLPAQVRPLNIESLGGTWLVDQGIATGNDLALEASPLAASGKGTIRLPDMALDYALTIRLPDLPDIPARVTGSVIAPTYAVDTAELPPGIVRNH